jgi:lysine 6-dehydrogenase
MRIAVVGAGLMGRAAVYDLSRNEDVDKVGVYDTDYRLAEEIAERYGFGKSVAGKLDAGNEEESADVLAGYDAAVSSVPYTHNVTLTKAAIAGKCHMVDLGGNNRVVREQLKMDQKAANAGVLVVPDCGLAPGMVSVLAADGVARMDRVNSLNIRVGGLPQSPKPPMNYQLVFSPEGLINEYSEPCIILEAGKKRTVEPMTGIEELEFDGVGTVEAFYTSGGTSTLPDTFEGKIDYLDYKTIRYPGHCLLFRPMLQIGLASREPVDVAGRMVEPRALLKEVLRRQLSLSEPDLVLVRLTLLGEKDGCKTRLTYEIIDRQDERTGLTAMMRTTAFPAVIIALMAAGAQIAALGVKPQEIVVKPSLFIPQLERRGIKLQVREEKL